MEAPDVVVNGRAVPFAGATPHTTALDWLRGLGLTGAKEGCAEGECGACSVMVARPGVDAPTEWTALNACLMPAAQLAGQEVVTAEGLADGGTLHPVQAEMAARGGSQCGYCTPGFVCSMAAEFYRPGREATVSTRSTTGERECGPNGFDLHALSGNLCRCTGYRPIREAAYAVGQAEAGDPLTARTRQRPPATTYAEVAADGARFVRPADLPALLDLLAEEPDAVLVAGSTDHGVEVNLRGRRPPLTVAVDRLDELRGFTVADDHVELGAALSLTEIERRIERSLPGRLPLVGQMTEQFASRLIRNGATLGGNLGTGSPIGDAAPSLLALEAEVVLASVDGDRTVPLADYFTGYRASVRRPGEVIRAVRIPLPARRLTAFHKIAKRRFDDISSVAVGFALDVDDGVVTAARIGLGGVAATPIRARATEAALEGRPWDAATVAEASEVLGAEGTPLDDHRASAAYRAAMLRTSLLRLHAEHPGATERASA